MKTLLNHQNKESNILSHLNFPKVRTSARLTNTANSGSTIRKGNLGIYMTGLHEPFNLLNKIALYQMANGRLPELWETCFRLYHTFFEKNATNSAMQFIPVIRDLKAPGRNEIERFIENEETNHILMQNELLKVVLIHWKPGKYSNVHGHPSGGCVFKVLHGQIEEKRYAPSMDDPELLAVSTYHRGGMGYIDDRMAYHAVGNPFSTSAISLHVYTPGLKNKTV